MPTALLQYLWWLLLCNARPSLHSLCINFASCTMHASRKHARLATCQTRDIITNCRITVDVGPLHTLSLWHNFAGISFIQNVVPAIALPFHCDSENITDFFVCCASLCALKDKGAFLGSTLSLHSQHRTASQQHSTVTHQSDALTVGKIL